LFKALPANLRLVQNNAGIKAIVALAVGKSAQHLSDNFRTSFEFLLTTVDVGNVMSAFWDTTLRIERNIVGPEGIKALAELFREGRCAQLTTLDLSWNNVGPEGIKALAESFRKGGCAQLTSLNLSCM